MIRRIKNSLKAGKTEAEITRTLQQKGYKLEYINILLKKSRSKKILYSFIFAFVFLVIMVVLLSGLVFYNLFIGHSFTKSMDMENPLKGMSISFDIIAQEKTQDESQETTIHIDEIKISPEFISYLLNEIGAWKLRPNPITREKPIINFEIDDEIFSSVVDKGKIITTEGSAKNPDIVFYSNKNDIVKAVLSDEPADVFKDSYEQGKSSFEIKKSEAELFSKGYFNIYKAFE